MVARWHLARATSSLYPISVTKIVEIAMYAINISGAFQEMIVQGICQKKVNNVPGVNLCQNYAFSGTHAFFPKVIA